MDNNEELAKQIVRSFEELAAALRLTEAFRAKPESCAADCSAGGPAAPTPSEPSVQPGGPEPLQAYREWLERKIAWLKRRYDIGCASPSLEEIVAYQICLQKIVGIIEGEAG